MKTKVLNKSTIVAAVIAFLVWGAWAFHINYLSGDLLVGLRSGITQGLYSAAMTIYFSISVLYIYKRVMQNKLWFLFPAMGTVGHTGLILTAIHYFNGTPEILKTVSLPLTAAFLYCIFVTTQFRKSL